MPNHLPHDSNADESSAQDTKIERPLQEMGKSGSLVGFLVQFLTVAVLFFAIGFAVGQKKINLQRDGLIPTITVTNQSPLKNQNVDFSLFWNVFEALPQKYFDKSAVDGQKMMYGAIAGMVRSLGDPYTAFLDPKQNEAVNDDLSGSYEGVGIQLGFDKEKRLTVVAPLKGTPAEREGVRAKDLILKIDKKDTFDLTLPEAVDLIRGSAGTRVTLQLLRDGEDKPLDKTLERAKIEVKTVNVEFRETRGKQIAVVEVTRFGEKTDGEWDAAIDDVLSKDVDGVIVDMRNNPGGLLASSLHLAGEFVKGTVVKQEFANGSQTSLSADHIGKLLKMPLVVLVNEGSASAAEIFAGAIQDNNRGELVGQKTFGKGTVQDVVQLPGGAGLHVTIARWLTPDGHSIHDVGITPEVVVDRTSEDVQNERDPQLDKALEII